MVKFWKGTREQSENFEGNTGTRTPPLGDPPNLLKSCFMQNIGHAQLSLNFAPTRSIKI